MARGQVVISCLSSFMVDGMPDRAAFLATIMPVLEGVRAAGYPNIRLFGEMVNLLWDHNLDATVELEWTTSSASIAPWNAPSVIRSGRMLWSFDV